MFSNLGLLKTASCPEKSTCQRIRCLFSHDDEPRQKPKSKPASSSRPVPPVEPAKKRSIDSATVEDRTKSPVKKLALAAVVESVPAAERAQAIKRAVQSQASPSRPAKVCDACPVRIHASVLLLTKPCSREPLCLLLRLLRSSLRLSLYQAPPPWCPSWRRTRRLHLTLGPTVRKAYGLCIHNTRSLSVVSSRDTLGLRC